MELLGFERKDLIEESIASYGSCVEHNYNYFCTQETKKYKPVFAYFGDKKGMLLVDYGKNSWHILMDPLCPENEKASLIKIFLEEIKPKSFQIETTPALRKELTTLFKNTNIKIGTVRAKYVTPIIYLDGWNPELDGSDFSNLRKAKRRFFRDHKIDILHPAQADQKELKEMVIAWKNNRKSSDNAQYHEYINFFNQGFPGAAASIMLRIDGKIRAAASGWVIPNDGRVYFGISLHDYSMPELGDLLTLLFLDELKSLGFKRLDFGSSDEKLLQYKKKFNPKEFIETAHYYISVK
jgi:hypothetical protein